ncbi:MAG: hypothetical protein QME40_04735, partial [bacterium]|nr:hypothetical protein [bacterium]
MQKSLFLTASITGHEVPGGASIMQKLWKLPSGWKNLQRFTLFSPTSIFFFWIVKAQGIQVSRLRYL